MSRPRSERLPLPKVLSHLGVMIAVAVTLGVVVSGLAIPFAGLVGFTAKTAAESIDDLPQDLETEALPQKTTVVDSRGNTIATVFDQNRINVSLREMSRTMTKAIVAIEDYRFYEHGALDLRGTIRAFVTNQASSGVVQGGSSITQQLVKQTLVNQADTDEERAAATDTSYARKLRELRYAIALEKRQSKDWILERYLNIAYFGDGAYGVQAAARNFYSVNASQLNLNQSATLAGLVKSPRAFDPTANPGQAKERRNVVLDRMAQLDAIPEKLAEKVKKRGLNLDEQNTENGCVSSRAPFFCDYVMSYLMDDPSLGETVEDRRRLINSGGLTVNTTLDVRFQTAADESVRANVYQQDQAIGALAMVEPRTGEVRAIAQSRPMGRNRDAGETFLNYVVPQRYGDSNGFQPGSTFKAFVLAAAINQGTSLNTQIPSPQQVFLNENTFDTCDGSYQSSGVWEPSNSTNAPGSNDLYSGTQLSVNTFFAQLEQRTGLCEPYRLAKDMGVELNNPTTEMVPSFTLGVADVSPLEMAEAYATFAGRGLHCASRPVTSIEDADGNLLKTYDPDCNQAVPASTADAVNDILRGVQEGNGFGASAGIALNQADAGKTGTTNDNKAVWFVGYTPNLSTAAMIAGANSLGQPITLNGQTVGPNPIASAFGSTVAGPMWGGAMQVIEQYLDDVDFTTPSGTDVAGVSLSVPDVSGLSVKAAQQQLETAGFETSVGGSVASGVSEGQVAFTSPGSGGSLPSGDTVLIYPSTGTPPPPPPENDGDNGGNGGNGGNGNGNGNGGGRGNGGGGRGN